MSLHCAACGQAFKEGQPLYEVACTDFYCTSCVLPGVAGPYPIVGDEVLIPTENGYDSKRIYDPERARSS